MPSDHRNNNEAAGAAPPLRPDAPGSPWRTHAAREAYRNPWITVTEYTVTRPDGSPGVYGVVDPGDNVTIVALTSDQHVWIVEDFLYPIQRWAWFLPTGAMDHGEDSLAAAQRELREETGLTARRWDFLGAFYLTPGIATQRSSLYLARDLHNGLPQREATELHMKTRLLPLEEAAQAHMRGDLDTPLTAVAALGLWLARERLRDELRDELRDDA